MVVSGHFRRKPSTHTENTVAIAYGRSIQYLFLPTPHPQQKKIKYVYIDLAKY